MDQAIDERKTALSTTIFLHSMKTVGEFWSTNKKMTLRLNRVREAVEVHVHAKYHQAECSRSWAIVYTGFLPYLAMAKNPKIRSLELDVWHITLKFSAFWAVVKIHVSAKYHQAECSGSRVIVVIEKTRTETIPRKQ